MINKGLLAFVAAAAVTRLAALDANEWKYRQAIAVEQPGIVTLLLPPETLDAGRANGEDLRLLDPTGRETPFLLHRSSRPSIRPLSPRAFRASLSEAATQLVLETDGVPLEHVLLATPAPAFIKRVRLETSADGRNWTTEAEDVPLFRQFGAEQLALRTRGARFLRITLDDSRSRPVAFTGATLLPASPTSVTSSPLGIRIAQRDEFAGETLLTLQLEAAHAPLDALSFATPERIFTRPVSVAVREVQGEAAVERTLATGTIYKVAIEDGQNAEQLIMPMGFTAPARELLVHIANGDSPPLQLTGVQLTRFEVAVAFDAATAGTYSLLSGHDEIAAPRYDVGALSTALRSPRSIRVVPGPLTPNANYRRPDPLAALAVGGAPLDPAPWRYHKAVRLISAGVQQLELDLDVLSHARKDFSDLRLLRDGVQVPYLLERSALSRSLPLALALANDPKRPQLSRWEIKLPRASLPLTRLTLTSSTALFQRHLRLLEKITDDRGHSYERTLASVEWSQTPGNDRALALPLEGAPTTDRLWLETDNGDNPPIALGAASAAYPVTRLLFKAEPGSLALYYGNREANAPRYDLSLVAAQFVAAPKQPATLDEEEIAKSEGWTARAIAGRSGILFWGALVLVVIALLVVVAKLLPKPAANNPSEK